MIYNINRKHFTGIKNNHQNFLPLAKWRFIYHLVTNYKTGLFNEFCVFFKQIVNEF